MNYTTRKVYLLTRKDRTGWDEAVGFVVVAVNARKARELAAAQAGNEGAATWRDSSLTKVSKIGFANDNSRDVVILRHFRAG